MSEFDTVMLIVACGFFGYSAGKIKAKKRYAEVTFVFGMILVTWAMIDGIK